MKKALVTGGLGFIGSNLVDMLVLTEEYEVWVMDNHLSESSYFEYKNPAAHYIIDDVANISQWHHRLGELDVIFHLGAYARIQPSFDNPANTLKNNILGATAVCEYARHHAKRVVYAGSSSFYAGPKLNPYAFSKWVGEEVCDLYNQLFGLSTVTARFFNVYGGPRQPMDGLFATVIAIFEKQSSRGEDLTITGDGEQRRDFTHVSDICRGLMALGESNANGVYNLGTGTNHSINEIANKIIQISTRNIKKKYISKRPGEAQNTLADVSKTQKDIGWSAITRLDDYLEKNIK